MDLVMPLFLQSSDECLSTLKFPQTGLDQLRGARGTSTGLSLLGLLAMKEPALMQDSRYFGGLTLSSANNQENVAKNWRQIFPTFCQFEKEQQSAHAWVNDKSAPSLAGNGKNCM